MKIHLGANTTTRMVPSYRSTNASGLRRRSRTRDRKIIMAPIGCLEQVHW